MSALSLLEEARVRYPSTTDLECIERVAAEVIRDLDERPPVSLSVLASYRDIADVRVEPMRHAGSLTPEPSGLVMRLNARDSARRRRFSGFHEVGHTFQPGYTQQTLFRCNDRPPRKWVSTNREDLADAAAAELLFPRDYFRSDLSDVDFGISGIAQLADRYEASLHATALRVVRLSDRPTMLVVLEPALRKAEIGQADAQAKLRVVSSFSSGGPLPFVPRNKSAAADSALSRALAGEVIDESSSLGNDLGLGSSGRLRLSARLVPYTDADGRRRDRVMAIYQGDNG